MSNEQIKVSCISMDEEGKGIIKFKGQELHVPNLLYGEVATVEIIRKKSFITAKVLKIDVKSKDRVIPNCPYFKQCGACQLQHLSSMGQSKFKQHKVESLMNPYGKANEILTMVDPYFYRNKVHSTIAYDKNNKIISGIYEENTHSVLSIEQCIIQAPPADIIIASIRELMKSFKMKPYNEDTEEGLLRHILVKTGFVSKEIMVVLVLASQVFPGKNNFVKALLKKHPELTTIVMNINNRKTSVVLGNTEKVLFGKGYIEDSLCGCTFQISPKSFYQINPIQTGILYNKAIEMANLSGNETVLDAYCGIGTISLIVSSKVKHVIGVELNKDAVNDATRNAKRNKVTNTSFYNDDAGNFMMELAAKKQDVHTVFMDPPRSGSDEKFLSSLIELGPKQVVYISCNPITQERDIRYLTKNGYSVVEIQPVDMFPQTYHVENVILMSRIEK